MNCILRGVRVIDPLARRDALNQDVWLSEGRIIAIFRHMGDSTLPVIDLTPAPGEAPAILCPGFIDLHAHFREPGDEDSETVVSGSHAAAAGGFTHVVTMANTNPPIDNADAVSKATFRSVSASVQILIATALTRGLNGAELVDMEECAAAGAVAFSDDGRNEISQRLLTRAIAEAGTLKRTVMVHAEDEEFISVTNNGRGPVARLSRRPVEAETRAVDAAIAALKAAGRGRLHLQHLSTAAAIDILRRAKEDGADITAEVTPHHLSLWFPVEEEPQPASLLKVNPPLRSERDRAALIQALREGIIDAVATDHAPHVASAKNVAYDDAAPGMIGLELALAVCITLGGMGGDWIPTLIERLTYGPYRALGGPAAGIREPRLIIGEAATCVLFDPAARWRAEATQLHSKSSNTPFIGQELRGKILMTLVDGAMVYHDADRLTWPVAAAETAGV